MSVVEVFVVIDTEGYSVEIDIEERFVVVADIEGCLAVSIVVVVDIVAVAVVVSIAVVVVVLVVVDSSVD